MKTFLAFWWAGSGTSIYAKCVCTKLIDFLLERRYTQRERESKHRMTWVYQQQPETPSWCLLFLKVHEKKAKAIIIFAIYRKIILESKKKNVAVSYLHAWEQDKQGFMLLSQSILDTARWRLSFNTHGQGNADQDGLPPSQSQVRYFWLYHTSRKLP